MRNDQLPSPGLYHNGQRLRVECTKAISHTEIVIRPGNRTAADDLRAFFQACVDHLELLIATQDPD